MRLRCSSVLPCPADRLGEELGRTALFVHVTAPFLVFTPVEPPGLPQDWSPGVYRFSLRVGGRVPLGEHVIDARQVDGADPGRPEPQQIWHDAGHSAMIRSWDHRIVLAPVAAGTRYTDVVEIHAGVLTLPAWLFAQLFYRHRQRRLAVVVAADFAY